MDEQQQPVGRPSKYDDAYPDQAGKLAKLGLTDAEMAAYFEVAESTFHLWKIEHPEFSESIKRGKVLSDADVADKLFERATGAEWHEEQAFKLKTVEFDLDTKVRVETERIEVISLKKAAPADTAAAIFWLKNRQPDKWRDKQQVEQATNTVTEIRYVNDWRGSGDSPIPASPAAPPSGDQS